MNSTNDILWNQIIKKEARALGGANLGDVKEVSDNYVITEKDIIDKDRFYIPRNSIIHVDGQYLWIRITEEQAKQYKRD